MKNATPQGYFSQGVRALIIGGLFFIPFLTLVVSNEFYFPFIVGKAFVFRILIEILFALWIILIMYDTRYRPRYSWLLGILTLFLVSIGVSDILAIDSSSAFWSNFERMEGYVTLLHLAIYFVLVGTVFKTERLWSYFLHTWLGIGFFSILYGYTQATGDFQGHLAGERIDGTLGNSTYLAVVGVFLFFFTLYFAVRNRNYILPLLSSYVLGSGLYILHSIFSFTDRANRIYAQYGGSVPDDRTAEFFMGGWHMTFFITAVVVIGASLYLWVVHKELSEKVLYWIHGVGYSTLAVLLFGMILFTRTRGAIIGIIGGLSLTVLLIALFARARPRVQRLMAVFALIGMLIGALFVTLIVTNTAEVTQETPVVRSAYAVMQEIPGLARVSDIELGGKTVRSRFMVWRIATKGFLEKPVFGWGQDNFHYVFNAYYDPRMFDQEPWFDRTHNVIFDWLIAGGFVGAFFYFAFMAMGLGYLWYDPDRGFLIRIRNSTARIMKSLDFFNSGEESPVRFSVVDSSIFTGLIVAYLFHNLFVFDNLISYLLFFSLFGFIYAVSVPDDNKVVFGTGYMNESFRVVLVLVVGVVAVVGVYAINVQPIRANMMLLDGIVTIRSGQYDEGKFLYQEALRLDTFGNREIRTSLGEDAVVYIGSPAVHENIKNDIFRFASSEFEKDIQDSPGAVRPYLSYGRLLLVAGHHDQALVLYEKARELSPTRQLILFQIGEVYLAQDEKEKALEIFKEAFLLEPRFDDARNNYMYTALLVGDEDEFAFARTHGEEYTEEDMALGSRVIDGYIHTEQNERALELLEIRVRIHKERYAENPSEENTMNLIKTYEALGGVLYNSGNHKKALEVFEEAKTVIPGEVNRLEAIFDRITAGA